MPMEDELADCQGLKSEWWGDNYCDDFMNNDECQLVMHERHFYRSSSGPVFFLSVLVRSDLFFIGPVRSSVFLSSVFLTVCRLHYVSVFILSVCKFVPFPNFSK